MSRKIVVIHLAERMFAKSTESKGLWMFDFHAGPVDELVLD